MNRDFYLNLHDRFDSDRSRKLIGIIDRFATGYVFFSFPPVLCYLWYTGYDRLLRLVAVTLVSFILVSVSRKIIGRKRPYEVLEVTPVLAKDDKGNSFPSRHVFSAFVIAVSCLHAVPAYAVSAFAAGILIMIIRVIGTVHFISDVIAGMILGILAGLVMFL